MAINLAQGLLKADPDDAYAHLVLATAMARAGHPKEARRAASLAYRHGSTPRARVQAAQLAARSALQEQRPTLTQLWLRRAALLVYGLPLAALIVSVAGLDLLQTLLPARALSPLEALVVIGGVLVATCALVIVNGRAVSPVRLSR